MARRHHRHRSMGHRRGRPVSRSRFFSTAGPGTSNSRTTTFFKPIAGLRDFAVATRSTMVQFFERVSSWLRRQHDDIPNIIHLESRRPQPLNFQAFRNRFLKHIGRIDLPRNGPLAQLPPEIQLETFFYLDYQSLLNLQSSCRYYEYFISAQMLEDSKERTKELYMDMEHRSAFPINQKPCYTCLQIKGHTAFHDPSGNRTYSSANPGQLNTVIGTRYCIPCGVKEKKFKPGEQIIAGGHTQAICKHCKRLNTKPVSTWRAGWACPKCNAEVDLLLSTGPIVRLAQAAFAIIIFALACSGQAVPRSSHLTHGTWRWVFTISLDLFTIGACVNSWFYRSTTADKGGSSIRQDDYTFFFPVELLGLLGWIAAVVGLIWEGTHPLYKGEFDRIAIALTVMSFFQITFFFLSLIMSSTTLVRRCCTSVRKIQDEYP